MTRVSGPRGPGRLPGSAGLAGYLVLRLAWRGFDRPGRSRPVTAAMTPRDAVTSRASRSGGKRARLSDRAAHDVEGIDEADPQRVLARQGRRRGGQVADGLAGAQQRPDLLDLGGGGMDCDYGQA